MKKSILALISVFCVGFSALGLTACVPDGIGGHNYSVDWRHTVDYHWHYCQDKNCNARDRYEYHNLVLIETYDGRAANCGKDGRGIWQCVDCGVTIEDKIPATGEHSYILAYADVEATCEKPGFGTYVCEVCGDVITKEITSDEAHVFDNEWVANEEGHYHTCKNCGAHDEIIPHTEVRSDSRSVSPQGNNDGLNVFVCEVCGEFIRDENVVNPNTPTTLVVNFEGVTPTQDEFGIWHVKFNRDQKYTVSFIAKTASGVTVPNNVNAAFQSGIDGVRAYLSDDVTGNEELLTLSNLDPVNWTAHNISITRAGTFTVVFKYETGGFAMIDENTPNPTYRERATYIVQIECS